MPRANRYHVPGYTYHLTHRCHNRKFLLRFALDRDTYQRMLWQSLRKSPVWLLAYCITCNHVHLLARSDEPGAISSWLQGVQGRFAQHYNRRKRRTGAFWEGRYHSTLIDGEQHLWRCMTYIELNMVRAEAVDHSREWRWCSYQEWTDARQRYRLLKPKRVLEFFGNPDPAAFRQQYERLIDEGVERGLVRDGRWTESIAVGDEAFVRCLSEALLRRGKRRELETTEMSAGSWVLKETAGQPELTSQNPGEDWPVSLEGQGL